MLTESKSCPDLKSSLGGSPLIRKLQIVSQQDGSEHGVHVDPGTLPSQPLSSNVDSDVAALPIASLSHSRQTSASERFVFGDAPLLNLEPTNGEGASFPLNIESWLNALEPPLVRSSELRNIL